MKPVEVLLSRADDILYGDNESLEDWRDALSMYESAANLGSSRAYDEIATMYLSGNFMKQNSEKAIQFAKKAIDLKYYDAAMTLCEAYLDLGEWENVIKTFNFTLLRYEDFEDKQSALRIIPVFHSAITSTKYWSKIDYIRLCNISKDICARSIVDLDERLVDKARADQNVIDLAVIMRGLDNTISRQNDNVTLEQRYLSMKDGEDLIYYKDLYRRVVNRQKEVIALMYGISEEKKS